MTGRRVGGTERRRHDRVAHEDAFLIHDGATFALADVSAAGAKVLSPPSAWSEGDSVSVTVVIGVIDREERLPRRATVVRSSSGVASVRFDAVISETLAGETSP